LTWRSERSPSPSLQALSRALAGIVRHGRHERYEPRRFDKLPSNHQSSVAGRRHGIGHQWRSQRRRP